MRLGLAAARRLGDLAAQARAHRQIARDLVFVGEYDTARFQLRRALRLYRALGDVAGICETHRGLAVTYFHEQRRAMAKGHDDAGLSMCSCSNAIEVSASLATV
ncbi:hypothetical protein [Catenulispora sp. MAP12-49]|uniref:hypothetical protein n=1 Tax=Catenulispora sp. MAP12-49 TaxID=3156302 RepID=UPI003514B2CD